VGRARAGDIESFLADLEHRRKPEILLLRRAILEAVPDLTEHVKWNAPSYCIDGDDRVTFRLQPGDRVELIFHRGARPRSDSDSFAFDDPTGLLQMIRPDRGAVTFVDSAASQSAIPGVQRLVQAWIAATR
jgi:Domain of unknown function (DU1801)